MDASRLLQDRAHRKLSLLLVLLLHAGALLLALLSPGLLRQPLAPPTLTMIDLPAPPPPVADEGASPPAVVLEDVPVSVPPPPIEITRPLPAPPLPTSSDTPPTGSDLGGPGGLGADEGAGLGEAGDGPGAIATRARRIAGNITRRDFARVRAKGTAASSVSIRLSINATGRPIDCQVFRPSGDPARDQRTCQLALQRFRYEPARNKLGQPVEDIAGWRQDWWPDEARN